jgi:hypothetical protein
MCIIYLFMHIYLRKRGCEDYVASTLRQGTDTSRFIKYRVIKRSLCT